MAGRGGALNWSAGPTLQDTCGAELKWHLTVEMLAWLKSTYGNTAKKKINTSIYDDINTKPSTRKVSSFDPYNDEFFGNYPAALRNKGKASPDNTASAVEKIKKLLSNYRALQQKKNRPPMPNLRPSRPSLFTRFSLFPNRNDSKSRAPNSIPRRNTYKNTSKNTSKKEKRVSLYNILKVNRGATFANIKKAYRKQQFIHHPDKGGNAEKFKEAQRAFEILGDKQKREAYDKNGSET